MPPTVLFGLDIGEIEGVIAHQPVCINPLIVFSTHPRLNTPKDAWLDVAIVLIEAYRTLTPEEKLSNQEFGFDKGFIYKATNGDICEDNYYFPMEKKAPATVERCMN